MNSILENSYLKIEVSDLGARIIRLINKRTGNDLIMGQSDEQFLKYSHLYMGAAVGRNAQLIVGSSFVLNNKRIYLSSNNGNNQLHGGQQGFSFVKWNLKRNNNQLIYHRSFKDGTDGYPGNMNVCITYELIDNSMRICFFETCDSDSIFNPTLHMYFNMNHDDFEDVYLKIESDICAYVNCDNEPLDTLFHVSGSAYDFIDFSPVKKQIQSLPKGIDTNYVFENLHEKLLCTLKTDTDCIKIYSDLPGLEMYTCNDFHNVEGKDNKTYDYRCGVALEPGYFPNSVNFTQYLKPIVYKEERVSHSITYIVK